MIYKSLLRTKINTPCIAVKILKGIAFKTRQRLCLAVCLSRHSVLKNNVPYNLLHKWYKDTRGKIVEVQLEGVPPSLSVARPSSVLSVHVPAEGVEEKRLEVSSIPASDPVGCVSVDFQKPPFAQSNLVRVIKGAVLDVAVDIRKGSPIFGQHVAVELTEKNHRQFFIPRGFAHGFSVLSEEAISQYKCDEFYHPEAEGAIAWNDAELGIDWRVPVDKVLVSEKDKKHLFLENVKLYNNEA